MGSLVGLGTMVISGQAARRVVVVLALATTLAIASSADVWAGQPGGGHGGGGGGGREPFVTISAVSSSVVEGNAVGPQVATFTDLDANATASEYSASVIWGDGSPPSSALVTRTNAAGVSPATFSVSSRHVYADAGDYYFCVGVVDVDTQASGSGCGMSHIQEATIVAHGVTDALANPYCDSVASFTDLNNGLFDGYTTTIDWGDGTSSAGTVNYNPNGGPGTDRWWVYGCHTYADLGPHSVTTTIADSAYVVTATSTAWVYAPTDNGTFVIGDGSASTGAQVTFWGAQWTSANTLSGGVAPESFKGFAPGRSSICNGTWTAKPGNSSPPPATVPSYTAVLVSSSITKDEAQISGNSVHVALVRTDPGYGPTPDQAGTGTVVFMIC